MGLLEEALISGQFSCSGESKPKNTLDSYIDLNASQAELLQIKYL